MREAISIFSYESTFFCLKMRSNQYEMYKQETKCETIQFINSLYFCITFMRGSRSTAKLQMEFLVRTMPPFIEKYTLPRIAVTYF